MKVKAIEKKLKFTKDPNDPYRCVMQPEQDCKNNKRSRLWRALKKSHLPLFNT